MDAFPAHEAARPGIGELPGAGVLTTLALALLAATVAALLVERLHAAGAALIAGSAFAVGVAVALGGMAFVLARADGQRSLPWPLSWLVVHRAGGARVAAGVPVLRTSFARGVRANEAHDALFRALVETSGDIVWAVDANGCITYVNGSALEATLGYRPENVLGFPLTQFAERATAQAFDDELFRLIDGAPQLEVTGTFYHREGHKVHLAVRAIAVHDGEGRFAGANGTAVDVSGLKEAETRLRRALDEQEAVLDSVVVGIAIARGTRIVRANRELERMFGFPAGGLVGMRVSDLCAVDQRDSWQDAVRAAVGARRAYDNDVLGLRRDGSHFWCRAAVRAFDAGGNPDMTIWVAQDISDRKQKEEAIVHAALHDTLTGLPNRALLSDRLVQAVRFASRAGSKFGVLFLDLDRFKYVNDTVGHDAGDQLLRVVANRLRSRVRSSDTVARQGGDEFIVMLPDVRSQADIERIAANLLTEIVKPIPVFGNDYVVSASIGISIYPDHGADAQSLLRNADAAMYRAKELGKNTYRVFSEDLHQKVTEDIRLEQLLRGALDSGCLDVHYQPRVDLASGRISSVEALARWDDPVLGPIEPTKFVAAAERAGLIGRLGEWVLRRACRDLTELSAMGFPGLGLSVNVSHSQLSDAGLVTTVRRILDEHGLAPQRLELELTETAIARNLDQAVTLMQEVAASGIGISIDDFGTGYSSLSQLKRFPIRTLKIDRAFVDGLPHDADDAAIVLAVIAMAKSLKMRVVAEGVETQDQCAFLLRHECDEVQGYLFSRPVPFDRVTEMLRSVASREPGSGIERLPRRVA
ncbi:MAG TPA: EAL domain-containing protein [Casimicrobiaceae bacterium]